VRRSEWCRVRPASGVDEWGYACEVIAPSLIPKRPGVQRKHDKRDATDLARFYRAGELVVVRIPSEADERVRDVVRCRETFQRELLKVLSSRGTTSCNSWRAAVSCFAPGRIGASRTASGYNI
jgi:transposase